MIDLLPRIVDRFEPSELAPGIRHALWVPILDDPLGRPERLPVLAVRGRRAGPTVVVTAAVHGDELNGVPVVQRLFRELDPTRLRGTLIAVLVVNLSGFHRRERRVEPGQDLNTSFPGRPDGTTAEVLAWRLAERFLRGADALVDLHTASRGRVNSLYVRADMRDEPTARMAYLQRPQIIVHKPPADGTLRGRAAELGIPAITVEIGDPQRLQTRYTRRATVGLKAVLAHLGMLPRRPVALGPAPVLCRGSRWMYTDRGGLLQVVPDLTDRVQPGDRLARLHDVFGRELATWTAEEEAVVVGHAVDPVARTGARIIHLGHPARPGDAIVAREDVLGSTARG